MLVLAPVLGLLGVIAAEAVPDDGIREELTAARAANVLMPVERPITPLGTSAPHYTECTAYSLGVGDEPGRNLVDAALASPAYIGCQRLVANLETFEATGTMPPGTSYLRYWHGYAMLTRPALSLFGVSGVRWLAFAGLALAAGAMTSAVNRAHGAATAGLLLLPALLTTDMVIGGLSAPLAIGMTPAWLGGWLSFEAVARRPRWRTAALVGALAGAASAYFDLMTTIPGAFALTAAGASLGALAARPQPPELEVLRSGMASAVGWVVGLVWMWGSKWIIAALVIGFREVVDNVKSQIEVRVSGDYEGVDPMRLRGFTENVEAWWNRPLTPWVLLAVGVLVGVALVRFRGRSRALVAACCGVCALPVIAWYMVLNNHSQIHAWLVYRSLPLALGGIASLVYAAGTAPPQPVHAAPRPRRKATARPT